jgi:hypothetical protein
MKRDLGRVAMDRQQREAELREMLTTQRGKEELLAILKEHAGIKGRNLPPFETLLVETILNFEYPPETERTGPAPGPTEPGDVKFEEPPGNEAPGG